MTLPKHRTRFTVRRGFGLIDTILSLGVISILVIIFANLLYVRTVNRRTFFRVQAAAIATEELSALKRFNITSLPNQTDGSFIGMLYNGGDWEVTADPSIGHSAPNVVVLAHVPGFSNTVSGRLQFPAGSYTDATFAAAVNFLSDTPSGSATGIFFRAADAKNGYRLLVAPTGTDLDTTVAGQQNWVLEKVVNGTPVTPRILSTTVVGITLNAWNEISVTSSNSSLRTYLNGLPQDSGTLTDGDFTTGQAALIGWRGAHVAFDDVVTTVGANVQTWGFDGSVELPTAWMRFGLNDLPDSTPTIFDDNGKLTLTPSPDASSTTLKQATITVAWRDGEQTLSYTTTALLGSSHIGL